MDETFQLAREIPYLPPSPAEHLPIGLIGCGGISANHLRGYRRAGFPVTALCDIDLECARARQAEFFPAAAISSDYREVLKRDDVAIVDITTHPRERPPIIAAALEAGRHVLSQKPFVEDLDEGDRLCDLADRCERVLAVNQNGRWAPHFSYARQAVATGVIGAVTGVHMSVHWDHSWIKGTAFEQVKHLILYDYAIHWFDMVACLFADRRITRVSASTSRAVGQDVEPHLLGQALIECSDGQASLAFDGFTPQGTEDRTFIAGSSGSISSIGPGNKEQTLTVSTADWTYQPALQGCWFPDGFRGTMGELQASLLTGRPPSINARDNLRSLELCFAAVASAELGRPVNVGDVRRLPA